MEISVKELEGKIITKIDLNENKDEIIFHCKDGTKYKMYHEQDCSEIVSIEDIIGTLNDLIDSKVIVAEERTNLGEDDCGTYTWTFYTFRTHKGSVDIRWYGSSNGYYCESVDFVKANSKGEFPSLWE